MGKLLDAMGKFVSGNWDDEVGNTITGATKKIGELRNNVSGQTAAMEKQYQQNVNIAQNQYKWAVEDMKRAGLNPAMMFGGGGGGHTASTSTSIGGGGGSNVASMINSTANLVNSFNKDNDRHNNANVAQVIRLINTLK